MHIALGIILALTPAGAASSAPTADSMLAQGRRRLAIKLYAKALARKPGDPGLRIEQARAQAQLGWCAEATPTLLELQDCDEFGLQAGLDLSRCLADELRYAEALSLLEDIGRYADTSSDIEVERGWIAMLARDGPLLDQLAVDAEDDNPASLATWLLLSERAWLAGDSVEMHRALDALTAEHPRAWRADLLRAWDDLEVGDVDAAATWLRGQSRVSRMQIPVISSWLAEVNRRQGRPELGAKVLRGQAGDHRPGAARLALRIRLDADLGDVAGAQAAVDELIAAHPLEPEVLATAWYLARVRGDRAAAADLQARYERVVPMGRAPLHNLLPPDRERP